MCSLPSEQEPLVFIVQFNHMCLCSQDPEKVMERNGLATLLVEVSVQEIGPVATLWKGQCVRYFLRELDSAVKMSNKHWHS